MAIERSDIRVHEPRGDNQWLTGLVFVALAAQFVTVSVLAASTAPGYDFAQGAISDLGAIDETAPLFDASLVAAGALNLVGGYLFYRAHGARWILAVYVLAAVGTIGAGVVPLDDGDLHRLFALAAFLGFNLEAITSATRVAGPMKGISVLAGLVGIAFVAVMAVGDAGTPAVFAPIGHGGAERLIVSPPMLWLLAFGGYLLAEPPIDAAVD
ncbi:DUF998 domain-containing protein [Haloterrigena sp. SYSU A121-1]|uniref:DUF998 domain-containing protein n=1 Tax=Haloterrigena gelatinilytica TaxID=2741724 RepID=A0A8J8KEQ3_9EURY|nr:DUF998 domain-containing protein [Haloterrigena gelatinilytica]NUB90821.1 DUF998 domain-containing protein [Haloterrigena gelatinilytica]